MERRLKYDTTLSLLASRQHRLPGICVLLYDQGRLRDGRCCQITLQAENMYFGSMAPEEFLEKYMSMTSDVSQILQSSSEDVANGKENIALRFVRIRYRQYTNPRFARYLLFVI